MPIDTPVESIDKTTTNLKKNPTRYCRRCSRIVLDKHHHCPWINSCVGQHNQHYFKRFLVFASLAAVQASVHLLLEICHTRRMLYFNILNIGLSVGVAVAVLFLFIIH